MKSILRILVLLTLSFSVKAQSDFDTALEKRMNAEYDSSIYYFNQALLSQNNVDTSKAYIIIERGKSQQLKQSYDFALSDYKTGLSIFKQYQNLNGVVQTYIYLAEFYRHLGRHDLSTENIALAEQFIDDISVRARTKALFFNRKAAIQSETGDEWQEDVIKNSNKAIEISEVNGFKNIEASSLNQLGFLYSNRNDPKGLIYYQKALKLFEEIKDVRSQVNVLKNITRFHQISGDYNAGIQTANKGIELIGDKKWYLDLSELLHLKMVCYGFLKNYKKAYDIAPEYLGAHIGYIESQHNKNLQELETKYEVEEKDKQILLEQEKAKRLEQEKEQKKKEVNSYILISVLLAIILAIALFAYYKIRKSNKLLNQSIEQKEILLQEVHHRVKNNLTVLNSLLYIQADETYNENTKLILNECQTRIQSMALVHQNLYDVDDASQVKLEEFIKQLILESKDIFGLNIPIETKIEVSNIEFDMSFTVFLGLIINELLTNTFKYAFDNQKDNWVKIELVKNGQNYNLIYSDSGKGLHENFDINETQGFGFKLIKIMVNQIHGTLDYSKKNNSFAIQFKKT